MAVPYRLRAQRPSPVAATPESLGPLVRTFRAAAQRHVVWAAGPFALLLAYVVWLGHEGRLFRWFNSTFSVGAVSTLFVLAMTLIVYTAAVGGSEVIRVHTNGILDLRGQARAVSWDQMRSLVAVCDGAGAAVLHHVLRTEDGAALSLGPSIGDVGALVDEVRVRMTELKAGALEARVAAGGAVRFGAIEARSDGLILGGNVLPWREVGAIEAEGATVVVCDRKGEAWGSAPLGDVPNAFLLAELAERRSVNSLK